MKQAFNANAFKFSRMHMMPVSSSDVFQIVFDPDFIL